MTLFATIVFVLGHLIAAAAMMSGDGLISLAQATQLVPGSVHLSTIWRWAIRGVRGQKLRTRLIGGRRFTTASDIREFLERLNQSDSGGPEQSNAEADNTKNVEKELEREGW